MDASTRGRRLMVAGGIGFLLAMALGPWLVRTVAGPWLLGWRVDRPGADEGTLRTLVVLTPHVEQIRHEFGWAFDRWHRDNYGEGVRIDWRAPGGTTEIRRLLEARYASVLRNGQYTLDEAGQVQLAEGTVEFDMLFGGGSFEFGRLASATAVREKLMIQGREREVGLSVLAAPAPEFSAEQLRSWYGDKNEIGTGVLYHAEQRWFGAALSGFGIVFNRDALAELGVDEPDSFDDLADPRLAGEVAMADPRMSGSVATLYESILNARGFEGGWRLLRVMSANARGFASSATKPPIDVGQGEAAVGVVIDFYGRAQAQSLARPGEDAKSSRVGYIDPPGEVYIDADPVAVLRGARDPELARRFVEFVLSDAGQALWQLPPVGAAGDGAHALGPRRYALRRLPALPGFYERHGARMIDRADPFQAASRAPNKRLRDSINVLMSAMAIDAHDELVEAWAVLRAARGDPGMDRDRLERMEAAFFAMPTWDPDPADDQPAQALTDETVPALSRLWRAEAVGARARIELTAFFRSRYREVIKLGSGR